jgi:hypothetical protein
MANKKAIFYFNVRNESGHLYSDVSTRITAWENKISTFLGKDFDVLVVPVLNRESDLMFMPSFDPTPSPLVVPLNEDIKPKGTTKAE